jgi:hypothetical protein
MGTTPPPPRAADPWGWWRAVVASPFLTSCAVCVFCLSRCVAQIMTMVMSCCYCFKRK